MKRFLLWLGIAICCEIGIYLLIQVGSMIAEGAGLDFVVLYTISVLLITLAVIGVKYCWASLRQVF